MASMFKATSGCQNSRFSSPLLWKLEVPCRTGGVSWSLNVWDTFHPKTQQIHPTCLGSESTDEHTAAT